MKKVNLNNSNSSSNQQAKSLVYKLKFRLYRPLSLLFWMTVLKFFINVILICCQTFPLSLTFNLLLVCTMLQFQRIKQKKRRNLILYYAELSNTKPRIACIYACNHAVYIDLQLYANTTDDDTIDRYKIITRDYNSVLQYEQSQFNQMLNLLIYYVYEKEKHSPSWRLEVKQTYC